MRSEQLLSLRCAAEQKFGRALRISADFKAMVADMPEQIGDSTLKRIWGYSTDHLNISISSINVLARYVGYKNYDEFVQLWGFPSRTNRIVHAASNIVLQKEIAHSTRCDKAFKLFEDHKYDQALLLLKDEHVENEVRALSDHSNPFVESIKTLVRELIIKALLVWCCDQSNDKIITQIDAIYNTALPLAKSINNHLLLWNIYQEWAYKQMQAGFDISAMELYQKALAQARILQIESPTEHNQELVLSLSDIAFLLCYAGEPSKAETLLAEAVTYNCNDEIKMLVLINLGLTNYHLNKPDISIKYYTQSVDHALKALKADPEQAKIRSSLALALHSLGILHKNTDKEQAKIYFERALIIFEKTKYIPDLFYPLYKKACQEELDNLYK